MPKALRIPFVILVAVIFVGYYWTAVRYWHLVPMPGYAVEEVDLLGGKTPAAWAEDPTYRREHLRHLDRSYYQPTAEGLTLPDGTHLGPETVLTEETYRALLEAGQTEVTLRNPAAIREMAKRNYRLRDPMPGIGFDRGERLTKEVIDALVAADVERAPVVGAGEMISIQFGTMLMVILIFLGLVAALQNALWDPVLALIDERRRIVEEGENRTRSNRTDALELEAEDRRLHAEVRREYMKDLSATQREAAKEADGILQKARDEAQQIRHAAHAEIERDLARAASELEKERDDLAREIAEAVLGRKTAGTG